MSTLLWNIFLAVVWAAATGDFSPANLLAGLALGFGVLWFSRRALNSTSYFTRARRSAALLLFFLKELVIANFRVAHDVITPTYHMRPAIVSIPLDEIGRAHV